MDFLLFFLLPILLFILLVAATVFLTIYNIYRFRNVIRKNPRHPVVVVPAIGIALWAILWLCNTFYIEIEGFLSTVLMLYGVFALLVNIRLLYVRAK